MSEQLKKEFNPLSAFGKFVMQIFGLVGMVSITEDIVAWKSQIIKLIDSYQKLIYYPFLTLQIDIPERIIDYCFIGSLLGISYAKSIDYGIKEGLLSTRGTSSIGVKIFYYILYLLFWPLGILITLKQTLIGERDLNERKMKIKFLQWVETALLVFFLALTVNTFFL